VRSALKKLLIPITAFLLFGLTACTKPKEPDWENLHPSSQKVLDSGYRRATTIEEAERKNLISNPRLGDKPVVFGFMHKQWLEFVSKFQPGDVLIEFYTPPAFQEMIHGYAGYEIVRNGQTVATLITST